MVILGIDSSGNAASCAISDDDRLLGSHTVCNGKTHSETIMPMIVELFEDVNIRIDDVETVAVTKGPGSYTGLRIGGAIAKGIAQALDIPIIPVPTMRAIAANIAHFEGYIVPILDAKAGRVYTGVYRWCLGTVMDVKPQFATDIEGVIELINSIDKKVIVNGDGAYVYRDLIRRKVSYTVEFADRAFEFPKAEMVNLLAYPMYNDADSTCFHRYAPEYLRPSQAERMKGKVD